MAWYGPNKGNGNYSILFSTILFGWRCLVRFGSRNKRWEKNTHILAICQTKTTEKSARMKQKWAAICSWDWNGDVSWLVKHIMFAVIVTFRELVGRFARLSESVNLIIRWNEAGTRTGYIRIFFLLFFRIRSIHYDIHIVLGFGTFV